jgi:hypothetical protein
MSDVTQIGRDSVEQQAELFRIAEHRYGLKIGMIAEKSGISLSTLKGWRSGAAMPAWALGALGGVGVPDHVLSLVTLPGRKAVHSTGDVDLDDLAVACGEFSAAYGQARTPNSEASIHLGHVEKANLEALAAKVRSAALGS